MLQDNVTLVAASFGGIEGVQPLGSAAARSTTVKLMVMATKAEMETVVVTAVMMMVVMTIVTVMVVVIGAGDGGPGADARHSSSLTPWWHLKSMQPDPTCITCSPRSPFLE